MRVISQNAQEVQLQGKKKVRSPSASKRTGVQFRGSVLLRGRRGADRVGRAEREHFIPRIH